MPYHNPVVLASEIAVADILLDGRYEFGVGRGHGWMPPKAGIALTPESRERYEESVELLFTALENERFSYDGKHFQVADSGIVPRPDRKFRVFLGGTSDRTYELAAERGWAVVVPPLLPYAALAEQLDLYRAKCAEHGTEPDIVWIHACYIDEDREVAKREAEKWMVGFLQGNASPLTEYDPPPADELNAAGYGFYTAGILEKLAQTPYDAMIDGRHRLGRDAGGRDRADRGGEGAVRGADRGLDHGQRRRRRALAGDQGPGAVRLDGDAALPGVRAGGGGRGYVSIERVCVVGGGAIGSLYAAHLSRVADVWVLTRRPEHARALEEQGLEVSGRAEFTGRVHATDDASKLPEVDVAIVATKGTALDAAAGALAGHFPDAMVVTVQNGLGAEQIVRRHGDWPLVSGVTFMSGTRHDDTHIEYILDTETWLGPYNGIAYERVEELAELIQRSGLKARAFPDLKPAQWSKLIFNATVNAVAALTGLPHDPHFAAEEQHSDLGHLVHALMDEGKAVAAAAGIELHEDPWEMNVHATRRGKRALPVHARGRRGAPPDGDRADHRLARPRGRAARRAGAAAHDALPPDQGERRQLPGIQREAGMTAGKRWGAFGALLAVLALAVAAVGAGVGASQTNAQAPIVIGWAFDSKGNMAPFDGPALAAAKVRVNQINAKGGVMGGRCGSTPATRTTTTPRRRSRVRQACSARVRTSSSRPATSTSRRRSCRSRSRRAS